MEFIKNIIAVLFVTAVWVSGVLVVMSVWWGIKDQDVWYTFPFVIALSIVILGFVVAKYNVRFKTALENPLELWGL
jgi:NADH:ubiquinone oxidoreductase subunit 6 (subunit J)